MMNKALIDEMESAAVNREWTPEQKAEYGMVVSFWGAEVNIQRGVRQIAPEREKDDQADREKNTVITKKIENPVDSISEPLLKKMSSERTLAVQAALMQQPQKAVALMVWRLCSCVFDYGGMSVSHPFGMKVTEHYTSLVSDSPAGKTGKAWHPLMQEKARLQMAFCTASSVYGVQIRECGHIRRSDLDGVETAIGFDMRDWWTPIADNFLSLLSKQQIVDALNEAGKTGAAADAAKMKKKDAAEHAEHDLAETRWVPEWMLPPAAVKPLITDDAADVDDHTAHAA